MIWKYLKYNWILSLVGLYFGISILLKIVFHIDILFPCIWKKLFDEDCPGCGLTTAFLQFIQGDFLQAWHTHKLIYAIIPSGIYFIIRDVIQFNLKYAKFSK